MNKLGNALYEIHHMDMLAAKDQWVNRLHPLVKLVLTIVFLTVTMSFPKYHSATVSGGFGLSCRSSALWGCSIRSLTVR